MIADPTRTTLYRLGYAAARSVQRRRIIGEVERLWVSRAIDTETFALLYRTIAEVVDPPALRVVEGEGGG